MLLTQGITTISFQYYTIKRKTLTTHLISLMPLLLILIIFLSILLYFFCMQIGLFFIQLVSGLLGILSVPSMRRLEMPFLDLVSEKPLTWMDSLLSFFKNFGNLSSWIFSPYSPNSIMALWTSDVSIMLWLLSKKKKVLLLLMSSGLSQCRLQDYHKRSCKPALFSHSPPCVPSPIGFH